MLKKSCGIYQRAFRVLCVGMMTVMVLPHFAVAKAAPESFAPLVEKLMPAVVNISTTQKIKTSDAMMPEGNLSPDQMDEFRDFMERFGGGQGGMMLPSQPKEQEVQSLGSGFVIDAAGYVVTNNHVIDGAKQITVKFPDKSEYPAKIVGKDAKMDLALLKIDGKKPFPFVSFGNSDAAKVGDWIIAIGNPFGLGGTVTAGIISARERNINAGPFDDFIQTDAAINRGNSGGPMFNADGEVIGINSAIFSPSGGNVGIGFAVPSSMAQPVLKQLRTEGRTHRAWLGVKIQQVNEEVADSVGLDKPKGALVIEVTPDSPASKAHFKAGDVVIEFNGKAIEEMHLLPRTVAEAKIGGIVPVTVWRDGKPVKLEVKLGEMKDDEEELHAAADDTDAPAKADEGTALLGMQVTNLSPALKKELSQAKNPPANGVVVLGAKPDSVSSERGIRKGDIITAIGQQEVTSVDVLKSGIAAAKKEARKFALLRIWRKGENTFVTLPLEEKVEK